MNTPISSDKPIAIEQINHIKQYQAYFMGIKDSILSLNALPSDNLIEFEQQVNSIVSAYRALQDLIDPNTSISKHPFFIDISHDLILVIQNLHRCAEIDWITKGLLIEITNICEKFISDQILDIAPTSNWEIIQKDLFDQLDQHLSSVIGISSILNNQELHQNDSLGSMDLTEEFDYQESLFNPSVRQDQEFLNELADPFDLSNTLEEIHLFDDNQDEHLQLTDSINNVDELTTLFPSLLDLPTSEQFANRQITNQELSDIESLDTNFNLQMIDQSRESETSKQQKLPMPEMLAEIFQASQGNELGNDDETELQGVAWANLNHNEDNKDYDSLNLELDNAWSHTTILEDWINADSFEREEDLSLQDFTSGLEVNLEVKDDHADITQSNDDIEVNLQINHISEMQDEDIDSELDEFIQNLSNSAYQQEDLSIDVVNDEIKLEGFQDFDTYLDNFDSLSSSIEIKLDEDLTAWDGTKGHIHDVSHPNSHLLPVFSSDVDTAIEESPIYQNYGQETHQSLETDQIASHVSSQEQGLGIQKDDQTLVYSNEVSELDVKIASSYLENLGTISENLLIKERTIGAYLREIKFLADSIAAKLQSSVEQSDQQQPIAGLSSDLQGLFTSFTDIIDQAGRQSALMHSDILSMRQQLDQNIKYPISRLVNKFPRLLHDLSVQSDKQVELIVQGADIGLEPAIAQTIATPLEQLIRHIFEYAIEPTTERVQQGKSPQGKIQIIVTQSNDRIELKLDDDGRTDDHWLWEREQILCNDIRNYLHNSGFKDITIVNDTEERQRFTISLPNLRSLLKIVLVSINQICLAVPSKIILEVLSSSRASHLVSYGENNRKYLLWRDRKLPIINLDSTLRMNCVHHIGKDNLRSILPSRTETIFDGTTAAWLVIQNQQDLFALEVDACWGHQDGIIQKLEGDIALPNMFADVVVLGTGQAVPIINCHEVSMQELGNLEPIHSVSTSQLSQNTGHTSFADEDQSSQALGAEVSPINNPINSLTSLSDFFGNSADPSQTEHLPKNGNSASRPVKVLIVESSANVRRYLAMTLNKSGFVTEQSQDGADAIALLKSRQELGLDIDLVITDLEMPQMDGFKFLSNVRSDDSFKNLPIIVLTARNNENDQKLALDLGATAYFSKPYREQELLSTLKQLVHRN
ncbi:MAG: response regulator [Pseudanabaenaceae cyanobacterium bins.39]|nr:response regulator [Pseudanabaenaceae cyanobacterium bins.39]